MAALVAHVGDGGPQRETVFAAGPGDDPGPGLPAVVGPIERDEAEIREPGAHRVDQLAEMIHGLVQKFRAAGVFVRSRFLHFFIHNLLQAERQAAGAAAELAVIVGEHEGADAVIIDAAGADELAVAVDRHFDAVDGAVHERVAQDADAVLLRGGPGGGEFLRAGLAAELIGADLRHADGGAGGLDRAGVVERVDEGGLAGGRPAIVAGAFAGHGGEGRGRGACGSLRLRGLGGGVGRGGRGIGAFSHGAEAAKLLRV